MSVNGVRTGRVRSSPASTVGLWLVVVVTVPPADPLGLPASMSLTELLKVPLTGTTTGSGTSAAKAPP